MLIQSKIVAPHIRLRVKRLLPVAGEIVTGIGQSVNPMQTVARATLVSSYRILPLSEMLGIAPDELPALLEVAPGARITQGMTLVDKKGFWGRRQQIDSPVDGELYDVHNGRLIFRQTLEVYELRALVAGTVVEHVARRGVVLETFGSLIQAIWSTPHEDAGLLKVVASAPDAPFFPEQVVPEFKSAILVVGWFDQIKVLERAREMGVRGIIAGSMSADLWALAELLDLSVFVTDGVGDHGMSRPVFDILQGADGRRTALLGRTGMTERPQIVIQADKKTTQQPPAANEPLQPGQKVRLLRAPHINQIAEVSRLYTRAQMLPTGSHMMGADVRLSNGQIVFVPYANMEAII